MSGGARQTASGRDLGATGTLIEVQVVHSGEVLEDARQRSRTWFAVAAPGLEGVVYSEIEAMEPEAPRREIAGGVEVDGPLLLGARLNLGLRSASRVLLRLGQVEAKDFRKLRAAAATLPWRDFVTPDQAVELKVTARKCRLYHTGAIAERVESAIRDGIGPKQAGESEAAPQLVQLRGYRDRFDLSVDASGELLHRRGWRRETASAPLRETLASGVLALCGWDGQRPLVDPMCGSGTFAIEALAFATARPPGTMRRFAFEHWPIAEGLLWKRAPELEVTAEPKAASRPPEIIAADRDAGAVGVARRNAERAQAGGGIDFRITPFEDLVAPAERGLVVINPPYGKRAAAEGSLGELFRSIGRVLARRFRGWEVGVIVPDRSLVGSLGLVAPRVHALANGGLRIWLVHGSVEESGRG